MGILDIFKIRQNRTEEEARVGGMEDFMTLIRVYYQAVIAANLGITNLAVLPDLRTFKQALKVQTVNNRLGLGEKNKCKKMLHEIYGLSESFFKEIDLSIKSNCKNINEVQKFFFLFQGFSQDLLTVITSEMKWQLRIPSIFKGTIRSLIAKTVNDILTKPFWKDAAMQKAAIGIQRYQASLGYSAEWMTEYAYHIVMLAKKEKKPTHQEK